MGMRQTCWTCLSSAGLTRSPKHPEATSVMAHLRNANRSPVHCRRLSQSISYVARRYEAKCSVQQKKVESLEWVAVVNSSG